MHQTHIKLLELAENPEITEKGEDYETFKAALNYINTTLAKKIAGDGEGATALFEVKIIGAESKEQAVTLSKSVVTSSLTKAAIYGRKIFTLKIPSSVLKTTYPPIRCTTSATDAVPIPKPSCFVE